MKRQTVTSGVIMVGVLALLCRGAFAGVIASNAAITSSYLNAGGVEGNPADYVYDSGYVKAWGSALVIGGQPFSGISSKSWNRLTISGGSTISCSVDLSYIGDVEYGGTSDHNQILVTGAGTSLTIGTCRISNSGSYNNLTVSNGAVFTSTSCNMTRNAGAFSNNTIVVDGGRAVFSGAITIGYDTNHLSNSIEVKNGGVLTNSYTNATALVIGRYGSYNDVKVIGLNSMMTLDGVIDITQLGTSGYGHHNTLTLCDKGLLKLQKDATGSIRFYVSGSTGGLLESYVRFAAGFLAYKGNRTTELTDARVQVWNGTAWVAGVKGVSWTATYCADDNAAATATAGSYPAPNGLGGYTIYTGGVGTIPPPHGTVVMIR